MSAAHLVLLHHLPDPAALLADDVAMQLVRHLHVFCDRDQRLEEEAVRRLLVRKKEEREEEKDITSVREGAYQQGSFSQLTLFFPPRDGDDVALAGDKLRLWTDLSVFLWWSILT